MNLWKFLNKSIGKIRTETERIMMYKTPEGVEYSFVEKNMGEGQIRMGVRIHSGNFAGIVFTTSPKISFEETDDGKCRMNFSFTVEKLPTNLSPTIIESPALRQDIGDIVLDIIDREHADSENNNNNENRRTDPVGASE